MLRFCYFLAYIYTNNIHNNISSIALYLFRMLLRDPQDEYYTLMLLIISVCSSINVNVLPYFNLYIYFIQNNGRE